jgi:hypothetical protein
MFPFPPLFIESQSDTGIKQSVGSVTNQCGKSRSFKFGEPVNSYTSAHQLITVVDQKPFKAATCNTFW